SIALRRTPFQHGRSNRGTRAPRRWALRFDVMKGVTARTAREPPRQPQEGLNISGPGGVARPATAGPVIRIIMPPGGMRSVKRGVGSGEWYYPLRSPHSVSSD